VVVATIQRN